jgi:hypothetical protein
MTTKLRQGTVSLLQTREMKNMHTLSFDNCCFPLDTKPFVHTQKIYISVQATLSRVDEAESYLVDIIYVNGLQHK